LRPRAAAVHPAGRPVGTAFKVSGTQTSTDAPVAAMARAQLLKGDRIQSQSLFGGRTI
jgi:hypothetical protein